jgi:hypothetical protein
MSGLMFGTVLSVPHLFSPQYSNSYLRHRLLLLSVLHTVTRSHHCSLSHFTPISLHMSTCGSAHTLSCLFMYCSFASIGHADMMRSIVSSNCLQSARAVCFCLFVILLLQDILFVMPYLVLLSFHLQFLLSDLPR